MNKPTEMVVEFKVLIPAVHSLYDIGNVREMSKAIEKVTREYGGEYVIKEVRWA